MKYEIIFIGSTKCDSCKRIKGDIDRYWDDYVKEAITFYNWEDVFKQYRSSNIVSIPTVLIIDSNGNEIKRYSGNQITEENIKQFIDK